MAGNQSVDNEDLGARKAILIIFNLVNLIFGLGCLAVGLWLNIDRNLHAYLALLVRSPNETAVTGTTVIFIVAGILIVAMVILCFYALNKENGNLLLLYVLFLVCVLILLLTGGLILVVFREQIPMYMKDGMRNQIQNYYTHDNTIGKYWNRVQMMLRCCGVDGSWDYYRSNWWYSQNPGAEKTTDAKMPVPNSCCKLAYNEDRDVWWVDPQRCTPKDRLKCSQDAQGRRDGSDYLNGMGCYAAVTKETWPYIISITVTSLVISLLQIIGIVVGYSVASSLRQNARRL